jgi:hypothetical protein
MASPFMPACSPLRLSLAHKSTSILQNLSLLDVSRMVSATDTRPHSRTLDLGHLVTDTPGEHSVALETFSHVMASITFCKTIRQQLYSGTLLLRAFCLL